MDLRSRLLFLHDTIAAGNSSGAAYDALAEHATVVVPDLLGFDGSMLTTGLTDVPAHIAAIDAANRNGVGAPARRGRRTFQGPALALRWAAEHTDRIHAVVVWGTLYRDRGEADEHVAQDGGIEAHRTAA